MPALYLTLFPSSSTFYFLNNRFNAHPLKQFPSFLGIVPAAYFKLLEEANHSHRPKCLCEGFQARLSYYCRILMFVHPSFKSLHQPDYSKFQGHLTYSSQGFS